MALEAIAYALEENRDSIYNKLGKPENKKVKC
jgi:hypothetical protein